MDLSHPFLRLGHAAACGIHLGSAILILVLLLATDWLDYTTELGVTYIQSPGNYAFAYWFQYRPAWILAAMCALTALAHGLIASIGWNTYKEWALRRCVHLFSWLEYCLTAALMTWVLLAMAGTREFGTLVMGAGCLFVCNLMGLGIELALYGLFIVGRGRYNWREGWVPRATWLLIFLAWIALTLPFFSVFTPVIETYTLGDAPPWFVLLSIVQTFVLFANFGIVFAFQHLLYGARRNEAFNAWFAMAYLGLSFISKQGLTWILVGGLWAQST